MVCWASRQATNQCSYLQLVCLYRTCRSLERCLGITKCYRYGFRPSDKVKSQPPHTPKTTERGLITHPCRRRKISEVHPIHHAPHNGRTGLRGFELLWLCFAGQPSVRCHVIFEQACYWASQFLCSSICQAPTLNNTILPIKCPHAGKNSRRMAHRIAHAKLVYLDGPYCVAQESRI